MGGWSMQYLTVISALGSILLCIDVIEIDKDCKMHINDAFKLRNSDAAFDLALSIIGLILGFGHHAKPHIAWIYLTLILNVVSIIKMGVFSLFESGKICKELLVMLMVLNVFRAAISAIELEVLSALHLNSCARRKMISYDLSEIRSMGTNAMDKIDACERKLEIVKDLENPSRTFL
jgi:hypothetical protein